MGSEGSRRVSLPVVVVTWFRPCKEENERDSGNASWTRGLASADEQGIVSTAAKRAQTATYGVTAEVLQFAEMC